MSAGQLYTPQLLAAAVELASWPPLPEAPLHGHARAAACGSTIALDLMIDASGRIASIGLLSRACAIGQAAAAVFARHAAGRDADEIATTLATLEAWLAGQEVVPDWPDIALIAPAREFPGRHGAMLLPWKAARNALSLSGEGG